MNKGDLIQIKVDRYAFEGKGIGKIDIENQLENVEPDSFIVFVNGAYPGDTVSAKIKKLKKSYAEAITEEVITPSPQRVQPQTHTDKIRHRLKSTCQHGPERLTIKIVASFAPCCHCPKAPPCDPCFARDFRQAKETIWTGFTGLSGFAF